MLKKLLFCIALLMTLNSKVYSIGYTTYAQHACYNSCVPTAIITTLISAGILIREKDKDLIFPLVQTTALSTAVSGITCLSSIFISRTTPDCNDECSICNNPNDSIKYALFQSLRRHSHRLGTLAGLAAGAGGYVWYKNHYA